MTIQQTMCAHCGKPLSPVWRDKCHHCGVPMSVARPTPPQSRSVFRGVSREDALRQAEADAAIGRARGYEPESQEWSEDSGIQVLSVVYRFTGQISPSTMAGAYAPGAASLPRSRPVAALLAIVLGNFGIHKFYLGKTAQGVIYLILFWTGIPGFIAWIEAITYLAKSDEAWAQEQGGPVRTPNRAALGCLWVLALLPLLAVVVIFAWLALFTTNILVPGNSGATA